MLVHRLAPARPDPAAEFERERRLAEAERDHDRMKDAVLETDQHYVTRGGGGGLLPPRQDPAPRGRSGERRL
jgi:hypothetical protein